MFNQQLSNQAKQHGFTLLEIMLVLLLIGMVSVGVVMTLPNSLDSEQDVRWQAQRFRTLLQLAEDEALISGLELGLVFEENSYQFAFYDYQTKKWLPVMDRQIQGKVELPDTLKMHYLPGGTLWDEIDTEKQNAFIDEDDLVSIAGAEEVVTLRPQVYVMSSGEVSPFSLTFSSADSGSPSKAVSVSVSMNGTISLAELQQ